MPAVTPIDSILAAHGLTADEFCARTGLSIGTIRAWRGKRRAASVETALMLEEKLRIPRHHWRPDLWPPPATSKRKAA
jgi:transcriptional regulator with XRE-family HTH domain